MDGVVNVRKTAGPTSHDVVADMRRIFGQKRVGHAGTLDPMATGVLVVCLGKATRIVEYLVGTAKEYRALIRLGVTTDTQDSSGELLTETDASGVTFEALNQAAKSFVGEIEQVPPMISAIKHEGKALYKLARQGLTIERAPRPVSIYSIDVGDLGSGDVAEAELVVRCSSGTYIRTLCADIGEALGCGAVMSGLERTRVGRFAADRAVTVDQLREAQAEDRLADHVTTMSEALDEMPAIRIDESGMSRALHGLPIQTLDADAVGTVRLLSPSGELVAIATADAGVVKPRKVLLDAEA